jgi:hypothetical protein
VEDDRGVGGVGTDFEHIIVHGEALAADVHLVGLSVAGGPFCRSSGAGLAKSRKT